MWSIESLQNVFLATAEKLGERQVQCFIDALDECDKEEIRQMITFFEELSVIASIAGSNFYICFASRHYPAINIANG
jgi:hypothetical protein